MPRLKITDVISFSSEDPVHVAENLLNPDPNKKWKCKSPGEKSASVILQLEKASVISNVDVGNEGSAYVEVLVSRSSSKDDFKVLVMMSSFMTPVESRQNININKVRMFGPNELSKPICMEKWDRIKIVCSQPFNRHVLYGLSFITLHSPEDGSGFKNSVDLSGFALKNVNEEVDLTVGSLFARKKNQTQEKVSVAAAIRQASASPSAVKTSISLKRERLFHATDKTIKKDATDDTCPEPNRNRIEVLYTREDDEPNEKIDKLVDLKKKEREEMRKAEEKKKTEEVKKKEERKKNEEKRKVEERKKTANEDSVAKRDRKDSPKKRRSSGEGVPNKKQKIEVPRKNRRPFKELLKDVVIVISGIQNPDRANLRSLALDMGAKYKPDWDNSCTHLICAFANTPKFNQVRGKGKIVTRKWIEDCHSKKVRFPWRRYALDKRDKTENESEEEIFTEEIIKCDSVCDSGISGNSSDPTGENKLNSSNRIDEEEPTSSGIKEYSNYTNEGSDTEDEIERVGSLQKEKLNLDAYEVETDEEKFEEVRGLDQMNDLPDFFKGKTFYVDKELAEDEMSMLFRYITAYDGKINEDLDDTVNIVITDRDNAENLKRINAEAVYVTAIWVWECHNTQEFVQLEPYSI